MHERRETLEAEAVDCCAIWIGEGEELLFPRPEKLAAALVVGRNEPTDSNVSRLVVAKNLACGLENPRALVGIRVERNHQ